MVPYVLGFCSIPVAYLLQLFLIHSMPLRHLTDDPDFLKFSRIVLFVPYINVGFTFIFIGISFLDNIFFPAVDKVFTWMKDEKAFNFYFSKPKK